MKNSDQTCRIEGLSDSIFAFAATLLVISPDVPRDFRALLTRMGGSAGFVFAISFMVLMLVWYAQHRYFREYGLEDGISLAANAVLLMTVLFSTYPLKMMVGHLLAPSSQGIRNQEIPSLMFLFSGGVSMVSASFTAMFLNAYIRQGDRGFIAPNARKAMLGTCFHAYNAIIALVSMIFAYRLPKHASFASAIYVLLPLGWVILAWQYKKSTLKLAIRVPVASSSH